MIDSKGTVILKLSESICAVTQDHAMTWIWQYYNYNKHIIDVFNYYF